MKAIFYTISLVFITCLMIGPKSLLQISAWGVMLVEYSEGASLRSALKDTFSGARPCSMCISLAKTPIEKPEANLGQNFLLKNLSLLFIEDEKTVRPNRSFVRFQVLETGFYVPKILSTVDTPPPKFI
ncbi:MAG: hypothetical protein ACPGN3_04360 [Opitutales bacterium]